MLKYAMIDRELAYDVKKEIISIARDDGFISWAKVEDICCPFYGRVCNDAEKTNIGWKWSDLSGNNIFVRSVKNKDNGSNTFLYISEPNFKITDLPEYNTTWASSDPIAELAPEGYFVLADAVNQIIDVIDKRNTEIARSEIELLVSILKDGRRKCMVHKKSRKKNVLVEEWPCYFHCWFNNRIVKDDGTVVDQLLAVCEFQDGHIERINFDHIRFVEEWE